jgi:hypothetical protein
MRSLAESRMQKYQLNLAEQTNSDAHSFSCNNHQTTQKKQKKHYHFRNPLCSAHSYLHEHNQTEKEREEEDDWELEGDHMRPRQQ